MIKPEIIKGGGCKYDKMNILMDFVGKTNKY
jgi:hypothetical protein